MEAFGERFLQPAPGLLLHWTSGQQKRNMPVDLNGYWKMISNENFEEYMKALGE